MGWTGDVGLLVQSGLGTDEEERENQMEERVCMMEERENKVQALTVLSWC
jgi:hypothetical protein